MHKLPSLIDIALASARRAKKSDRFKPITPPLNDGFEISLGAVDRRLIDRNKYELINLLNSRTESLMIKNVLV